MAPVTCDIIDLEEKVKQLCSDKELAVKFVLSLRDPPPPPPTVNRPHPLSVGDPIRHLIMSAPIRKSRNSGKRHTTEDKELAPPPSPSPLVSDQFQIELPDVELRTTPGVLSTRTYPFDLNNPPPPMETDEDVGDAVPPSS